MPDKPLLFMKPPTAFITAGQSIQLPPGASSLHHEVELGVVIGSLAKNVSVDKAMAHVAGYCLALDMTDRKLQDELKAKGHPWFLAKGFDTSCPVSEFIEAEKILDPHKLTLWLEVNGVLRQRGSTSDMIYPIPDLISYLSRWVTLEPGDLVLTGTPEGVGPVSKGDKITCGLDGVTEMVFSIE